MHNGFSLRPRLENIHMHAPFGGGEIIPAITTLQIHLDNMLRLHLLVGNA